MNKFIKQILQYKNQIIVFIVVSTIAICLTHNLALVCLIASLILTYNVLNPLLKREVFSTKIFRYVFVFFIFVIILQCVILVSWILNKNFLLDATPALMLLIMIIVYAYRRFLPKNKPINKPAAKKIPIIQLSDTLSIIVAIIMILILVLIPLVKNGISNQSSIVTLTSGNVDDAAHLALINDKLQFNRGVLYHSDITANLRQVGLYPAGWHSANAVFIKAISPNISTGIESLIMYTLSKVFWFFILIYCFTKTIFVLYKALSKKKPSFAVTLWISCSSLLFTFMFLMDTFEYGFYTFIPQLIAALLLIPVLIQFGTQNNNKRIAQGTLLLLSFICVGGCLPWLLVLPSFLLIILLVIIDCIKTSKTIPYIKNLLFGILDNLPMYLLLIAAILVQLYVMLADHSASSVSFIKGILLNGGVYIYNNMFYIFILIGLALCIFFAHKKSEKTMRYLMYAILPILLFAGIIYTIQMIFLNTNTYYYYKVLNIFNVIALTIGLVGVALCINNLEKNKSKPIAVSISIIVILLIVQLVGFGPQQVSYIVGHRRLPKVVNQSIYKELQFNATQNNYNDKHYTFYYIPSSGDGLQNDISTMTVKSNKPDSACFNGIRSSFGASSNFNDHFIETIKTSCSGYSIKILTSQEQVNKLRKSIQDIGLQDTVTIQDYNDNIKN